MFAPSRRILKYPAADEPVRRRGVAAGSLPLDDHFHFNNMGDEVSRQEARDATQGQAPGIEAHSQRDARSTRWPEPPLGSATSNGFTRFDSGHRGAGPT